MKVSINLSKKSIKSAVKKVEDLKKKAQTELAKVFLQKCVARIIELANQNLMMTDVGFEVKNLIQNSWGTSEIVNNKITLSNTAEFEKGENLAVFVEFGVGIVGQSNNHAMSSEAGYAYNVPSAAKDQYGNWIAYVDGENSMNIESGYYEKYDTPSGLVIKTQGSPATMFLYKAWKYFETSGEYKTVWQQAIAEVFG